MSEFLAQVVRIDKVEPHDNADALDIAYVWGFPVVVRRGEFKAGDLASYIPVDAILPAPEHEEEFAAVYKYTSRGRVRAARLRSRTSMGLLWRVPPGFEEGDSIAPYWGITKYDDSAPAHGRGPKFLPSDAERDPGYLPKYDIENILRWPDVMMPGEEVVITEKLHGANFRAVYWKDRLWVGSRNLMVKPDSDSVWAQVARQYDLENVLKQLPGVAIYAEVLGVQDLMYGLAPGKLALRVFDTYDVRGGAWDPHDEMMAVCRDFGLLTVPVLYRGAWDPPYTLMWTSGKSAMASHIREGIVVKPVEVRHQHPLGRVILKSVNDDYLMRKAA